MSYNKAKAKAICELTSVIEDDDNINNNTPQINKIRILMQRLTQI